MRSAKPSTTAVLPTPASPVNMGLFCRLRMSISIARRISSSRPITGSIFPLRAACVRLVVNWSKAGVLLAVLLVSSETGSPDDASSADCPPTDWLAYSWDFAVSLFKLCLISSNLNWL